MLPPPYWPFGITPSKLAYFMGWSSVIIAIRFPEALGLRAAATASAELLYSIAPEEFAA